MTHEETSTADLSTMDEKKQKLVRETAKIPWHELQRFFAAGNAIAVDATLDLIGVALDFSNDNAANISKAMESSLVSRVSDQLAQTWLEESVSVWAVVVAPWVLVQHKPT